MKVLIYITYLKFISREAFTSNMYLISKCFNNISTNVSTVFQTISNIRNLFSFLPSITQDVNCCFKVHTFCHRYKKG